MLVYLFILNFATKKCIKNAEVNCNTILSDGLKIKIRSHIYKGEKYSNMDVDLNFLLTWKTDFLVIFQQSAMAAMFFLLWVTLGISFLGSISL